jgi:DNA-directed RNA polymerase beta subunit/DNA-directed RNA polymerase beta' subunit
MAQIDVVKQFEDIKRSAQEAVRSIFPVEGKEHKLELANVYIDDKAALGDFKQQARVKGRGGSWGANVYADLVLKDVKTGKTIDKQNKVKLFLLPKLTPRASYIVNGNEYQVSNQLRLRPGAYVKRTKTGDVKTQINLAKGGAANLLINNQNVVLIKVGQAKIPLYPILVGMGISENQIKNVWGEKAVQANKESGVSPQNAVKRFAKAFARVDTNNFDTAKEGLRAYIEERTEVDPEMTKLTLDKAFTKLSPVMLMESASKLIKVERGDEDPDDVDNLAFKEFFGVEDAIGERIEKNKTNLLYKIKRNLDSRDKISQIVSLNTFGNLVERFFTEDDRSSTPEQINPLHMYSGHEKISFLGPGSIASTQLATDEMRSVHPTHLSYVDPVHTPESERIGLNLALAIGAKKKGKNLVSDFWNIKKGKREELKPVEVFNSVVAYPDQWDAQTKKLKGNKIKAQHKGKLVVVPPSQVDYVMPFAQNAFALSTNMIPFMANDNGNRTMMAGKHMEQAIPLKDRDIPLVQNKLPGQNRSFEELVGQGQVIYATDSGAKGGRPIGGKVKSVSGDSIIISSKGKDYKIPLYNNFSLNQKTFMHNEPKVKKGDIVQPGQLIADSNYTKDGVLALGKNLRAAYVPYKGYNFEDGIVITETAAKKLTSEHIHKKQLGITPKTILNLGKFIANFPNDISPENRQKLDSDGVVKKGTRVKYGDVIIAAMKDTGGPQGAEAIKRRIHKSIAKNYKNISESWGMMVDGVVTEVNKNSSDITIHIRTEEPAKIGDKVAGRHGNKGIITQIIPDAHAPRNADDEPVEILLNPHGVISRINIGQMYESAAGKIANKTGKPFKVENFTGQNYNKEIKDAMKKAGVDDEEELVDPTTGKSMGKVHVGNPYILKLNKQSEVNFSVRGESGPVTYTTRQPVKGGEEGSKALDMLTMYSMLSHGSRANLKEMATLKSENNPEFWEALKYGRHLPAPKTPFVYSKFQDMLKGAGVDIKKDGSKMQLMPLVDREVKKLSKMEVTEPMFARASGNRLIETKGGLIDPVNLGGMQGDNWGHIELKEHMPNPLFEDAIQTLIGVKDKDYEQLVAGKFNITVNGKEMTGPKGIRAALKNIDVDAMIKEIKPQLETAKGAKHNALIKKYRFLKNLKDQNLKPEEAFTRKLIPVIPPKFRPIRPLESGDLAGDDTNWIYRNVALLNNQLKLPVTELLDEDKDLGEINAELNKQLKGLAGLETIKFSGQDKRGFIAQIDGKNQPKEGFYQSKVLRKNQNLVGRGTIIPEPQLHMDEVAIPEKMAWKQYGPFVTKELIRNGLSAVRAKEEIENKTPMARRALDKAMSERPLMLNRAPSLHKFSIMAFKPQITEGKAIKIPPLVVSGFNADFDGDTMTTHVPVSDKAVREAYKMMPSRNLYKPGTGSLMVGPSQESQLGFYLMTKDAEDRKKLNAILPPKFRVTGEMNKGASKNLFMQLSKELPNEQFAKLIDTIKVMGETAATEKGFSLAIKDIVTLPNKEKLIAQIEAEAKKAMADKSKLGAFEDKLLRKGGMQEGVDKAIKDFLKDKNNVVSMEDCGTKNGKVFPVNSKEILGRFIQGDQAGVKDETIIDDSIVNILKKKTTTVKVRSPLTCEAPKGTCRHCYGVDESGSKVQIGDNLGAKSAQTIAEPLTQMTMNTFHTGGVAGTGTKNGYQRINDLIYLRKEMKTGKSTLATQTGKVDKVEDSGFGGYNVYINGKKHVTGKGLNLNVKKGQEIKKGDPINEGYILPQELLELKNMREVQDYMTDELQKAYASEDINIDRKTFETVVRSITNRTKVLNDVPGLSAAPGDTISISEAENYNKNRGNEPKLKHEPYLAGITVIPRRNHDWMSQMGAGHIADAVIRGASQGWMSDTKGYHPIPAFAAGATFGEGTEGKY